MEKHRKNCPFYIWLLTNNYLSLESLSFHLQVWNCVQGRADLSVPPFQPLPSPAIARAPPWGAGKGFNPALLNSLNYRKENLEFSWFSPNFLPSCSPQLCYLYTDLYKQTNSKETRRVFLELYQFFLDRAAVGSTCFPHFHTCPASWLWPFSTQPALQKNKGVKALQNTSFLK